MARIGQAISVGAGDIIDRRPHSNARVTAPWDESGGATLRERPSVAPHHLEDRHGDKPAVDSRAIRGIALGVALSVPMWAGIILAAYWLFD